MCGDWLWAESGKPGKPAVNGDNRMRQCLVVTRRKNQGKDIGREKERREKGIPREMFFPISSLFAPRI